MIAILFLDAPASDGTLIGMIGGVVGIISGIVTALDRLILAPAERKKGELETLKLRLELARELKRESIPLTSSQSIFGLKELEHLKRLLREQPEVGLFDSGDPLSSSKYDGLRTAIDAELQRINRTLHPFHSGRHV